MKTSLLLDKALSLSFLNKEEAINIYNYASTTDLIFTADQIRQKIKGHNKVSWIIDRNVNITNVCYSQCQFCNFYRKPNNEDTYITTIDQYKEKIKTLFELGGNQLLLQGGLHPKLGIDFYENLFHDLKDINPNLKLHSLGPPEIVHLAKFDKLSYKEVLERLIKSGLDSLPGAGAEILVDRVRDIISPVKCNTKEWLDVMHEAHKLNLTTSATMMFGHIETKEERIEHLLRIRDTQDKKPENAKGFIAFIPWPFQDNGTFLKKHKGITNTVTSEEYIRLIALSRILLPNIENIQASWLTVGKEIGQLCLHAGANDFGSIMIEENVVSSAGANYKFDAEGIQNAIIEAGFKPQFRNQQYEYLPNPGK